MLAIAAQIPRVEIGGAYFQETHPTELFRECSVYAELVSVAEQMPRLLEIAMRSALSQRGVAVLVVLALYWGLGLDATKTAANSGSIIAQMSLGGWEVAGTCILVGVVGVVVGVVGSAFAVRRFLDV